jgi:hypothetical protein
MGKFCNKKRKSFLIIAFLQAYQESPVTAWSFVSFSVLLGANSSMKWSRKELEKAQADQENPATAWDLSGVQVCQGQTLSWNGLGRKHVEETRKGPGRPREPFSVLSRNGLGSKQRNWKRFRVQMLGQLGNPQPNLSTVLSPSSGKAWIAPRMCLKNCTIVTVGGGIPKFKT